MKYSAVAGPRPQRRRPAVIALAAAGVTATLALAACSSSGSSSSSPAAAAASGGSSAAASGSSSAAAAPDPANPTVLLDWFPNPDHASLYMAKTQGDFTKAGLSGVTLQAPSGSQDALKLVSTGAMALGISYEPNVVTAASQGLDVEAVAALVPTPLNTLLISSKSGITSIKGLAGKKIGTDGDPTDVAVLDTILKKNGVTPSSTQQIAVSEGLIPAMLSGNVQAIIGGYRNVEAIQLKLQGQTPVEYKVGCRPTTSSSAWRRSQSSQATRATRRWSGTSSPGLPRVTRPPRPARRRRSRPSSRSSGRAATPTPTSTRWSRSPWPTTRTRSASGR
jgi:ABC-type nitrate/sulfonate/bicarbonate transport system substrate-binding protein